MRALTAWGHDVHHYGPRTPEPVDFPDVARETCQAVVQGTVDRAIMICGTGVGAAIASNKVPGIRAAVCHDLYSARQCVEHDDVNVLCLGAQIVGEFMALEIIRTYLGAEFSTEEHVRRRVAKLNEMDRQRSEGT